MLIVATSLVERMVSFGGRPKKQNLNETKPKPKQNLNETKPKPKQNLNVNVNVNVNDNDNIINNIIEIYNNLHKSTKSYKSN